MCDPLTLTVAATAVSAIGTGASSIAAAQQARYQAEVADRNARIENDAARDALERGRIEDKKLQERTAQLMGEQNAALAANGIDIAFGSAANVRGDAAVIGQQDAATLRENSMRETRGFEINAANYRASAQASRQAASGALINGAFQIGSTILGGAMQYDKLNAARNPGATLSTNSIKSAMGTQKAAIRSWTSIPLTRG